jgi:hypothetical protein
VADWEPFAGLVSSVVALITWAPWYGDIFRVNRLAAPKLPPGSRYSADCLLTIPSVVS